MTIGRSTGLPRLYEDDVRLATFSQLLCPRSPSGTAIQHGPAASERALQALCKEILGNGLPQQQQQQQSDAPAQHVSEIRAVRATAWKLLLGVDQLQPEVYLDLVQLGSSVANDKIRNDTFRTLATDTAFLNRVREDMLVRLLDAYVWRSSPDGQAIGSSYVQGMNVLAAPFLYAMPSELEAFACFSRFLEVHCPLYVQKTMEGVHRGLKLLDLCLQRIDVELYEYMKSKGLQAEVYAFPSILTFSACTPPLDQVLELWDFLLAFGVHLNVLCVVAQLYLIRDEIMTEISPVKMLRTLPPLDARATIALCCQFVKELPDELYDKLARHPWDTTLQM